ncbi:MAG: hypothetical protein JOY79_03755 [Acidobacteriaceae bacterium]|nr:hypothetical protein [Acidobacteriaceae bacterium]
MKKVLGTLALLVAMALPGLAQHRTQLPPDDQKEFDKYYTKWVNDTRKGDRDDVAKDIAHMQKIMARNNIPATVPYEQVASTGGAAAAYPPIDYRGRLSAHDQQEFDKHYAKWVKDTAKNDKDDIAKDVTHMREIMARNNIPISAPFDAVASNGYAPGGYPIAATVPYGGRLSAVDQREFDTYFDTYYANWIEDTRMNDRVAISRDAARLQEIMARNNIPATVPFDQIATRGAYAGATPYPAAGSWQRRLSVSDQALFDKYYLQWLDDTRRNDRDDIAKDVGRMQEIMARNSIPATVPFNEIASPEVAPTH